MTDILQSIIEKTHNKRLHWKREEGDFPVFTAEAENGCKYKLSESAEGKRMFEYQDGSCKKTVCKDDDMSIEKSLLSKLYETIVASYPHLVKPVPLSVSLKKIQDRLSVGMTPEIKDTKVFSYKVSNPLYVQPNFSLQPTSEGIIALAEVQVIAISAPGCTGKTELTKYLSGELRLPVFDLNENDAVGSDSLIGMLFKTMTSDVAADYVKALKSGKTTMIIDALDEGYVKTKHEAFESFLNGIADIAKDNRGVPFVIMGRTSTLELSVLYLEECGVKVSMLQIEPFVRNSASEFIDKHVARNKGKDVTYNNIYKSTRDHILMSLEAFFKGESEINKRQSERFIGYAPVLLSIVNLLVEESNYIALKNELGKNNAKNVRLVLDIVEYILNREHTKIENNIRQLLSKSHFSNAETVIIKAYDIDEQCARILCSLIGKEYVEPLTESDPAINEEYEKHAKTWFEEHPFIHNGKIQNIVFEAYVVSRLMQSEKYRDDVLEYLYLNWRNSYILFDLYDLMAGKERIIDRRFVKYLIDSYKATEKGKNRHLVELTAEDDAAADGLISCELSFEALNNVEYEPFVLILKEDETLELPRVLSNMLIDAPISLVLDEKMAEFSPLLNISCKRLSVPSEGLLLTRLHGDDAIVIECDEFVGDDKSGKVQLLINKSNLEFTIITEAQLFHPFAAYKKSQKTLLTDDDSFKEKYQKLRRTIIQFRSHSKGALAKYKEKIDNRIGKTPVGRKVIEGLQRNGILEEREHMYFINDYNMADKLGLSYNELRTYAVNDKLKIFLNAI